NQNIAKILKERITAANSVINDDNLDLKDLKYYASLQGLVQVLKNMEEYIEEITEAEKLQKFLEKNTIEEKFKNLRKEYDTSMNILDLVDLNKFNMQYEDKVLIKDVGKLLKFQRATVKKSIPEILKKVTKSYKTAQHNQNVAKILMERITAANSAINTSQDDDLDLKDSKYYVSLQILVQVLKGIEEYIEE